MRYLGIYLGYGFDSVDEFFSKAVAKAHARASDIQKTGVSEATLIRMCNIYITPILSYLMRYFSLNGGYIIDDFMNLCKNTITKYKRAFVGDYVSCKEEDFGFHQPLHDPQFQAIALKLNSWLSYSKQKSFPIVESLNELATFWGVYDCLTHNTKHFVVPSWEDIQKGMTTKQIYNFIEKSFVHFPKMENFDKIPAFFDSISKGKTLNYKLSKFI